MTKRITKPFIAIVISLCLLLAMAALCFTAPTSARADETVTTESEVIVLDKIEDFRTESNGDGTYKILGLDLNADFIRVENTVMDLLAGEGYNGVYITNKTGISATGLRKILGLPVGDNCGLTKGTGDGVDAAETDEQFAERVYAALCDKFFKGEIGENGHSAFGIVIPANVTEVGDFAFVSSYSYGTTGGSANNKSLSGYNNFEWTCSYNGQESLLDIDIATEFMKLMAGEESELSVEEQQVVFNAIMGNIGGIYAFDEEFNLVAIPYNPPALAKIDYAVDPNGNRALKMLGKRFIGTVELQELTLPKDINVDEAYAAMSTYQSGLNMGLDFVKLNVEDGVKEIPDHFCDEKGFHLKEVIIPASVERVGEFGLSYTIEDIIILGDCVEFANGAFGTGTPDKARTVRVNSMEQWFSFKFEETYSNPLYLNAIDPYIPSYLYTSDGNGGWNEVETLVVPAKTKVKNSETGEITEEAITEIPDNLFSGCSSFTSLNFSSNITGIGEGAFYFCVNLKSVSMDSVTRIGKQAFARTGLTSVRIPDGVSVLEGGNNGAGIFAACKSLSEVVFSNTDYLTEIGASTFSYCHALESIVIPASVEKIGQQAFSGCLNLKSITFAGNKITEIPSFCFSSCKALTMLTLPEGVTSLGDDFIGNCTSLKEIVLPTSIKTINDRAFDNTIGDSSKPEEQREENFIVKLNSMVEFVGVNIFGHILYPQYAKYGVIYAADKAIYNNFIEKTQGKSEERIIVTYPVTLSYVYDGITLSSSNYTYNYDLPESVEFNGLSDEWYSDVDCTQAVTAADVLAALGANSDKASLINSDGEITLYAAKVSGPIFVAKSNLVYDGNSYSGADINELLSADSVQIDDDMTVTVKSYTDVFGNVAETAPQAVCNAGSYVIAVDIDGTVQEFELNIARRALDISALDWEVTGIDEDDADEMLESSRLYLYIDAQNSGKTYASLDYLDMSIEANRNRYSLYGTVTVKGAIARYRDDANITIGLDVSGYAAGAFTVTYGGTFVASEYGMYDASVSIAPSVNYTYYVSNTTDFGARGISMAALADGGFVISKTWYVAGMANWLVDEEDNTFSFAGEYDFGSAPSFEIPLVKYGDVTADNFGTASDPLSFTLMYGNITIGTFHRGNYEYYINGAMPAGNYTLEVSVRAVLYNDTTIEAFTRSFGFVITEATLPTEALTALNTALNGKTFAFDYDGAMHLLDADARAAITAFNKAISDLQPDRTGTVWASAEYDGYYGNFKITYNLAAMPSNAYFTENDLNGETVKPVDPNKYTVYYLVTANNFAPLVSDTLSTSAYDTARRAYAFYTVIVREIAIPTANNVTYNGNAQKADIASSEFYTENEYDGFVNAGTHNVTLTLVNSEYYRWAGKTLGEAEATVSFEITKAGNDWIEAPDVVRWIEGKYNEKENTFIGAAIFGDITYVITDTKDNVVYDAAKGINKLALLDAGTYILKATVVGTDNYNGLSEAFTIKVLEKVGLPWWAVLLIVIGALGLAALIIFILWKKGVFQIVTDKIMLAIKTKVSVDATIASVRAAKRMEEGRKSVAEAKRKERIEEMRRKAEEQRALPPEERAAQLEAKAEAEAAKAEKSRARSEKMKARAAKMRGETPADVEQEAPATEQPAAEAAATEIPETPTEE